MHEKPIIRQQNLELLRQCGLYMVYYTLYSFNGDNESDHGIRERMVHQSRSLWSLSLERHIIVNKNFKSTINQNESLFRSRQSILI